MSVIIGTRAHDFPYNDPDSLFSAISSAGYRAVQLACPKSFGWKYPLNDEQVEQIVSSKEKHGISIAVLGCYVEIADPDKDRRLTAVETYINALKTAKDIGAFCVGTETTHLHGEVSGQTAALDRLTDSVLRMADAAEKFGINMGIEPVFGQTLATPELACELKYRADSKRLKWIWDAINLLDPDDESSPLLSRQQNTAQLLGTDIIAMHIKDVKYKGLGEKKDMPLFEGEYDWAYPFRWAAGQKQMFVLREHAIPERSKFEIDGMNRLLKL